MSNKYFTACNFRNSAAAKRMAANYRKQFGLGLDRKPRRYGKQKKAKAPNSTNTNQMKQPLPKPKKMWVIYSGENVIFHDRLHFTKEMTVKHHCESMGMKWSFLQKEYGDRCIPVLVTPILPKTKTK